MRERQPLLSIAFGLLVSALVVKPAVGQANQNGQQEPLQVKPPPVPTGVIPLPQGPPPTGEQLPVPHPAAPLPQAGRPLKLSPRLSAVNGFVESRPIDIQEAVAIALYTNRAFALSVARLQQAAGRTGQARAATRPQFGINTDLTYFDAPTVADLAAFSGGAGGGQGGNQPSTFVITPQFNPAIISAITLPLDVMGTLRSAVSQAHYAEVAARIDVNRVRNQVVYDVKTAFYNALRANAQVTAATEAVNNALDRLSDANKNYAAGTAPRFDVISAQRDVAVAQQSLIDARSQLSIALASLKNTMGLDIRTRLRLSETRAVEYPPGVQPPTVPPAGPEPRPGGAAPSGADQVAAPKDEGVPQSAHPSTAQGFPRLPIPSPGSIEDPLIFGPEFDALISEALKTRPEVLESEAQVAAAQHGIQYARRSSLPSLSVSLSDTYSPNAAGFTRRNVGAATLGVSLPIFDGGLARARVEEAQGIVAAAEVNRRQAIDQTQVDVQQSYISLTQARDRVAVANVGLSEAREAYRLARVRYNAGVSAQPGVSPQLELSNAQTTLTQALTNQINALYDYNNARAQLDRAVGRYSFTGTAPGFVSVPSEKVTGAK